MNLSRKKGESFDEYSMRLIKVYKEYGLSHSDCYKLMFDVQISNDEARKRIYCLRDRAEIVEKEDMTHVSKSHKKRYDEIISEYDYQKRATQLHLNKIRKVKRDLVPVRVVAEEIKDYLEENELTIEIPRFAPVKKDRTNNVGILNISDWHIGYEIENCRGNKFNYEIAKQRVRKLVEESIIELKEKDVSLLYVINTGDTIEHTYMRKNQRDSVEFGLSKQINKSAELIFEMLVALSEYFYVDYRSVAGNHDRMNGDKKAEMKGDNANNSIDDLLCTFVELSKANNIEINELDEQKEEIVFETCGFNIKAIHGDGKTNDGSKLMKQEMSMDDEIYDIIIKGHLHNFSIVSENNGRYIFSTGCLSGYNDYSTNFGCKTNASQTLLVLGSNKEIKTIKDIQLQ